LENDLHLASTRLRSPPHRFLPNRFRGVSQRISTPLRRICRSGIHMSVSSPLAGFHRRPLSAEPGNRRFASERHETVVTRDDVGSPMSRSPGLKHTYSSLYNASKFLATEKLNPSEFAKILESSLDDLVHQLEARNAAAGHRSSSRHPSVLPHPIAKNIVVNVRQRGRSASPRRVTDYVPLSSRSSSSLESGPVVKRRSVDMSDVTYSPISVHIRRSGSVKTGIRAGSTFHFGVGERFKTPRAASVSVVVTNTTHSTYSICVCLCACSPVPITTCHPPLMAASIPVFAPFPAPCSTVRAHMSRFSSLI
jgi:hypothetical protein